MTKTLIFTATYNEKENIKILIEKIVNLNKDTDILVIDDNSPDQTGELLKDLQKTISNLKIIIRGKKLGLDTAHKLAFNYSKENNYQKLITLDADLSHDPMEIPKIIDLLDANSFVIGSRYMDGGSCEMSFLRLILSIIGNKIIKYILNIKSNEFTTSFRGFNLVKLTNFNLDMVNSKGYSFFMETIFILNKLGYNIYEIPIQFKNRTQGKSKIAKLEVLRTLKNLLIIYFKK
ncbi:glycosyltransferase [Candidatus Pelagibacter ubique]|nr:glycosyltransferase [Candidatus Pelagibacter ubique]